MIRRAEKWKKSACSVSLSLCPELTRLGILYLDVEIQTRRLVFLILHPLRNTNCGPGEEWRGLLLTMVFTEKGSIDDNKLVGFYLTYKVW